MDEIIIIIGLILLNGIFAMSEVALISARKSRFLLMQQGSKAARMALKLANERIVFFQPYRLVLH